MSMQKAVFFDRDGTINIEKNYMFRIEDFEYLPGAKEGMKMLQDAGYKLIIVTNQSGIARGYYTEDDYKKLNSWMLEDLRKSGIDIVGTYYCPHHPEAKIDKYKCECKCRKPGIYLFEEAIADHDIDVGVSFALGDKMRDLEICKKYPRIGGYLLYSEDCEKNGYGIMSVSGGILTAAEMILKRKHEYTY